MEEHKSDKLRSALAALIAKADWGDISAHIKLYRFINPPCDKTGERRKQRRALVRSLADKAGAPYVAAHLDYAFAYNIGHFILTSPSPADEAQRIFRRTKRGRNARSLVERNLIAFSVQILRDDGFSLEKACQKIAEATCPRISRDAVRRIYENIKRSAGNAPLLQPDVADALAARVTMTDADF
jgi:hypothetical protein